ncbi:MAG: hypothetical protein UR66_C0001G0045 [Candidatus Moranbacteria bacterium GW2011_GWE1_35_17]|nr:MAG: hypothetical protein UR66_C0001G0045 [Candidatus Moranbacteria bacterium GW2011_GWE1_35_17]
MKKIIKKLLLFSVVFIEVALLIVQPALALSLGKPKEPSFNANKAAQQLENRYHVDKDSVKDLGESFNVGEQKTPAAEVDIFFNPTNPKFGEKVTATAIPKYFQEGVENMYFTWYIKHPGCEDGLKKGDAAWKGSCDVDGNDRINIDDWKIEAMRTVANGGFIKAKANYSSDTDSDGYGAHKGGRVNVQETDYCYLHDFISGKNYEMAIGKVSSGDDDEGCGDGQILCANTDILECGFTSETTEVPQYDMGSSTSSSSSSSSGGSSTSTTEENNSTGGSSSSSSSTETTIETPAHQETTYGPNKIYTEIFTDSGYDPDCDPETDKTTCPDSTIPLCVSNEDLDLIEPNCNQIIPCIGGYAAGSDCDKILNKKVGIADPACKTKVLTEDQVELKCEHKFPKVSGMEVGDGNFGAREEDFWGTDPNDPSTIDNENNDEANVAGLGMDKASWTYTPGDKIGVIVEGQAYLPTKHDDSSVAISYALVNNIFNKEGDEECKIERGVYANKIRNFLVEIPFAYVDIDKCLKFNLVAPTDGNQADNMETTMDFYPKNPNIGSLGTDNIGKSKGGDTLTIASNTSDPNVDTSQIYYKWSIYGFKGTRDQLSLNEGWVLLSNNELFRKTNNIKLLEGLGLDQLELQLNTTTVKNSAGEDVTYDFLRFSVESEEFFDTGTGSTGTTRSGRSDILIEPSNSGSGGIKIEVGKTEICKTGGSCEVLENQIITATLNKSLGSGISNYLWLLDGKSINTLKEGETKQGNSVTFLLEGRPGDNHILSVVANDTASPEAAVPGKNSGEKLTISKDFVVTKLMVGIGPNNRINRGEVVDNTTGENICKDLNGKVDDTAVMGTYVTVVDPTKVDPADPKTLPEAMPDCKENVFNGSGSVTITPTYYPAWIGTDPTSLKNVKYSVNGTPIEGCTSASCTIDLSAYSVGSMVNISFEAEYWQSDAQRANLKSWGLAEGETGGKKIADSITVKVSESSSPTMGKKALKIIAGLAYNIPEQMIFMFRLMMTVVTIIFASGVIMTLGQKKS